MSWVFGDFPALDGTFGHPDLPDYAHDEIEADIFYYLSGSSSCASKRKRQFESVSQL